MMLKIKSASMFFVALAAMTGSVSAASLQVAPTTVEVAAGSTASTINIKNTGAEPLKAQVRVFHWTMVNGIEKLEPATDVVASPPLANVKPNTDYTVRLVRLSKQPVAVEETYRIFIDEIPEAPKVVRSGFVNMAFRYSIPVFFLPPKADAPALTWSQEKRNGKVYVSATNTGGRRVRLADLNAADKNGKQFSVAKGLAGYVLARSSMSWVAPVTVQKTVQPLLITAQSDSGPIDAQALPPQAR
jgi:fimbrial chaperone protein